MADRPATFGLTGMPNNGTMKGPSSGRRDVLDRNTTATGRYTVKSKTKLRVRVETLSMNQVDAVHVRPEHTGNNAQNQNFQNFQQKI
ncbi:Oidioi.mRNA.OKI2018_I69.chr2.g4855.t1.cds [Oikopleura dioica]|uniref:Oidioi.mRNA.OKI2018_I69.chr2.g4855.t1.cds n=1 Tax=Oikopleura dioica TaxID=34765 RepID=A0ABN7T461_OIKDI|nr:Oidioi.mRNA.OKI2018_I69.chr2.g4855.t1.cds [Oikopleura dioica]